MLLALRSLWEAPPGPSPVRATWTADSGSGATSETVIPVDLPAGTQSGDTLIVVIALRTVTAGTWRVPSGWTEIGPAAATGAGQGFAYRAVYGTDVTGSQWTWDAGAGNSLANRWSAGCVALNGTVVGSLLAGDLVSRDATTTTITSNTVNPGVDNYLIGYGGSRIGTGPSTYSLPGPWSVLAQTSMTGTNAAQVFLAAVETEQAAGSTSATATESTSSSDAWFGVAAFEALDAATVTGAGALTATAATLSGAGTLEVTGTGALSAAAATLAGSGTVTVTGAGALAASAATLSGSGALSLTGTGAVAATPATLSGAGTLTLTGAGALTASAATLSGSGTSTLTGTGSLTAAAATLSGSGTVTGATVTGTGALTATAATLAGSGALTLTGSGAATATAATLAGSGSLTVTGSGSLAATSATLGGSGSVTEPGSVGGTGNLTAPTSTLSGSGSVTGGIDYHPHIYVTATLAGDGVGTALLLPDESGYPGGMYPGPDTYPGVPAVLANSVATATLADDGVNTAALADTAGTAVLASTPPGTAELAGNGQGTAKLAEDLALAELQLV